MKRNIKYFGLMGLMAFAATACGDEDIDNTFSRSNMVVELTTSTDYVVLDESRPDDVALTISWTDAHPYGNEFITTYQLQYDVTGSKVNAYKEYEDDGHFTRSYTNAQLQKIMVERYGALTSSVGQLNFTLTASFEGPRVVIPDIATASVRIKTYGAKQFAADRLFVAGTAVGDERIEVQPTTATSGIYVWNGALKAGRLNIPVIYADENNAIGPETADAPIRNDEMDAVISDEASANFWVIPADDNYRVTVDMNKKTVKIIAVGSVIEMDKLYMAGAATGGTDIEVEQTMERESLYAWRGELKAGKLTFPVEFDGKTEMSLVPAEADDHDIHDGTAASFKLVSTLSGTAAAYWEIPADATYRVVVDTDARTVTIYSPEKDLKNTVVSYNNTVDKINPLLAGSDRAVDLGRIQRLGPRRGHEGRLPEQVQDEAVARQSQRLRLPRREPAAQHVDRRLEQGHRTGRAELPGKQHREQRLRLRFDGRRQAQHQARLSARDPRRGDETRSRPKRQPLRLLLRAGELQLHRCGHREPYSDFR